MKIKQENAYKSQLLITCAVVVLAILDLVLFYISEYAAGSTNKLPLFALGCLISFIMVISYHVLFLISVVRFLFIICMKKLTGKHLFICLFLLFVVLTICVPNSPLLTIHPAGRQIFRMLNIRPAGAQIFLKGFENWAVKNIDTGSIQLWMQSANESYWESEHLYCDSRHFGEKIPEDFPDFLKDTKLQYIRFRRSNVDNSKIIEFQWGGGMFHWSLVVGEPNMKMPEKETERYSDYDVEFRRFLRPGVYVFSRG